MIVMFRKILIISMISAVLLLVGTGFSVSFCQAGSDTGTVEEVDEFAEFDDDIEVVNDPLEIINRPIFTFNHNLHIWLVEPTAKAYRKVTPRPFRTGIVNFFGNLLEPTRFLNSCLQGRFVEARDTLMRFLLNSTVGVAGLMDPATYDGMKVNEQRFSSTLAHYGVGSGPYLVIPFFGPSNPRGICGLVGDTFASPLFYLLGEKPLLVVIVKASKTINQTSFRLGEYEKMLSGALDPYAAVRDVFTQHQQKFFRVD